MLTSYLTGVLGVAAAMVLWALVQQGWGRVFFPSSHGVDALERRGGCGSCGCVTRCVPSEPGSEKQGRLSATENDEVDRENPCD